MRTSGHGYSWRHTRYRDTYTQSQGRLIGLCIESSSGGRVSDANYINSYKMTGSGKVRRRTLFTSRNPCGGDPVWSYLQSPTAVGAEGRPSCSPGGEAQLRDLTAVGRGSLTSPGRQDGTLGMWPGRGPPHRARIGLDGGGGGRNPPGQPALPPNGCYSAGSRRDNGLQSRWSAARPIRHLNWRPQFVEVRGRSSWVRATQNKGEEGHEILTCVLLAYFYNAPHVWGGGGVLFNIHSPLLTPKLPDWFSKFKCRLITWKNVEGKQILMTTVLPMTSQVR